MLSTLCSSRLYDANLSLIPLAPLPPEILASLPEGEVEHQKYDIHHQQDLFLSASISRTIRKVIAAEQQYIKDLNFIEEVC